MELETIGPHVEIVKPASSRPKELGTDGVAFLATIEDLLAVGLHFSEVFWLIQAKLFIDVLTIVDTPLIEGIRHAPLLAIKGQSRFGRRKLLREHVLFPEVGDIFKQARIHIRLHAVGSIPSRNVRSVSG